MSSLMWVNVGLAVVNAGLALVLGAVYLRNHRALRSPLTAALLAFSAFLLVHSAVTAYHFLAMMTRFSAVDETLVLVESLLQTAATTALVYATWR